MAAEGLIRIVDERASHERDGPISLLTFQGLR
jgi:hypothetical protein